MTEILSLWRFPLDSVGISEARRLADRQPRCTIAYGEDFSAMTIFNYGHYVSMPLATPTSALTTMFAAMIPSSEPIGGRAFVPQQNFGVNAGSSGFTVPDQCDVDGSGGGGALGSMSGSAFFHFVITPTGGAGGSTFFNCTDAGGSGGHTSGGMYFRSLAFQWGETSQQGDTCISAQVWNVKAINCTFTNCPIAFNANSLSCTLEQCTIDYNVLASQGPNNTRAVILASTQDGVIGPGQFAQTSQASGGATGCTCISIESAEHALVSGMQILEWTTGVDFSRKDGAIFAHITNCEIECWQTAVNIQLPASASNTVAGIKVTSCTLTKASDSTDGVNPIVRIDSNGNAQSLLNDIALIDCTVYNMAQPPPTTAQHGLVIAGGSNIRILGGTYSNNAPYGGAGIAITGACEDVQIIGVNLQPSYPGAPNVNTQKYALLVSSSPTSAVIVSGCDMTGYSGPPVNVTATQTKLLITDCPGYNDQNTSIQTTAPTSSPGASASSPGSGGTPYFGPSLIIWSGTVTVTLHLLTQTITSNFGIVFLPSPYDSLYFSGGTPTHFSWIGK